MKIRCSHDAPLLQVHLHAHAEIAEQSRPHNSVISSAVVSSRVGRHLTRKTGEFFLGKMAN